MFTQCDERWQGDIYGMPDSNETICDAGDLLTSLSMMIDGCSLKIQGQ
jgi:hypothetical protein